MKRRKVINTPALLLVFLCTTFIVWQIFWAMTKEFFQYPSQTVKLDITALEKVHFLSGSENGGNSPLIQRLGYSISRSLSLSYTRDLPETRDTRCQSFISSARYKQPSVSVVVTYHEVDRSVLLRNIASIVNRANTAAIKEIILVDDGSSDAETGKVLQKSQGIKVIRNRLPRGRGIARVQGAMVASGEAIVFIDSLSEMNVDWLSPLLHRLSENPKSLVAPVFDVIDSTTFEYKPIPAILRGGMDWSLQFQWVEVPSRRVASPDDVRPFKSPIQSGAVFAVRKDFFTWLGKYDISIGGSGVEDIDLSLRTWLCGGYVEIVPCSHVGLIQTSRAQLGVQNVPYNSYLKGAKKVAELWLDDYKRFFYAVRPSARMQSLSNLTSSRRIRERNKCDGFKWFLSSVYPQLLPLVSDEIAFGTIRQKGACVDLDPGQVPLIAKVRPCKAGKDSQEWSWRKKGVIVSNGMCLTSDLNTMHGFVAVQFCKDLPTQEWHRTGLKIVHKESNLCLDSMRGDLGLVIAECVQDWPSQAWQISSEVGSEPSPEQDFSFSEESSQL